MALLLPEGFVQSSPSNSAEPDERKVGFFASLKISHIEIQCEVSSEGF